MFLEVQEQPTHVLLAAGVTGRPNVDWCEDHQAETIRANVLGVVTVVGERSIKCLDKDRAHCCTRHIGGVCVASHHGLSPSYCYAQTCVPRRGFT